MTAAKKLPHSRGGSNRSPLAVKLSHKRRIIIVMWTIWFAYLSLTSEVQSVPARGHSSVSLAERLDIDTAPDTIASWRVPKQYSAPRGQLLKAGAPSGPYAASLLQANESQSGESANCTPPAILDFPPDLFTQEERQSGYIIIHFIASLYVFYSVAVVCDDYFVPAIEQICAEFKIPSDIAGASFMAIATSAPELFTNVIGTFVTEGDIGVGTIVGSAVFNILAVCACCGFAAKTSLPLDWYPLTRDCLFYLFSVILLIVMLGNRQVYWYEALILVLSYVLYVLVMWKNAALKKKAESLVGRVGKTWGYSNVGRRVSVLSTGGKRDSSKSEKTPLLGTELSYESRKRSDEAEDEDTQNHNEPLSLLEENYDEILIAKAVHQNEEGAEDEEEGGLFHLPRGEGCGAWLEWIVGWPARLVFTITIPDCRRQKYRRFYLITFLMCIVYIAILSYVVSWLMTVIGHTFRIPDSVMGLTFIAAGTSVPEAVSSVIVARQGLGSMSISNSIGSNTFDILMCLGLPWLIRASMIASDETNFIQINSAGLEYSVLILMISLVLFYVTLACNSFHLDKKVATISLTMYGIFLVFASLFEMNVFFLVNLPTCNILGSV